MKKKIGIIVVSLALVIVAVVTLSGKQGLISLYQNHRQYKKLTQELIDARNTIDSLKIEVKRLRNDTDYIEKIAREKLGMAGKNEKIVKFVEEPK